MWSIWAELRSASADFARSSQRQLSMTSANFGGRVSLDIGQLVRMISRRDVGRDTTPCRHMGSCASSFPPDCLSKRMVEKGSPNTGSLGGVVFVTTPFISQPLRRLMCGGHSLALPCAAAQGGAAPDSSCGDAARKAFNGTSRIGTHSGAVAQGPPQAHAVPGACPRGPPASRR